MVYYKVIIHLKEKVCDWFSKKPKPMVGRSVKRIEEKHHQTINPEPKENP